MAAFRHILAIAILANGLPLALAWTATLGFEAVKFATPHFE
jgi:hypothetical protein